MNIPKIVPRNTFSTSISKKLLISLLALSLGGHLTGCAMGGSSDEEAATGEETFAEESSGDFEEGSEEASDVADGEEAPAEEVAEGEEPAEGTDDLAEEVAEAGDEQAEGDDLALDEEAEEAPADAAATDVADSGDDLDDELSLDEEEGLPSEIASNLTDESAPITDDTAPTDAPVFAEPSTDVAASDTTTYDSSSTDSGFTAASDAPTWVPVKKVRTEAFMSGSTNLNRVYLARPGDTAKSIATKIYGDSAKSKDLRAWNSSLGRGVKTGDKIYYSSPSNPADTNMITYFEDAGVPPQNYVSREGDNIREVSKTLLGDNESWKEVWATNPDVESKGTIPGGLSLRYWPDGSAPAAPVLAQNPPAEAPPMDMGGAADPLAPPPSMNAGADPLAPPPADPLAPNDPVAAMQQPGGDVNAGMNDPLAAPTGTPASVPPAVGSTDVPPPPVDPPPVAPPPVQADNVAASNSDGLGDSTAEADNMMMMGLAGIVLLAAGAVFFLMRRSRSRKVDLTQTTQIG